MATEAERSKVNSKLLLLLTLFMVGCGKTDLTCNVIHEPKGGCPSGYGREFEPRFTEKNGAKEYACVSHEAAKEGCIDELRPGESVGVEVSEPANLGPTKRKL